MRFGSVCSGIEAASVAWEPLGWKAVWLSEIEKFPSAVLEYHWPDVPNLGDMTKLTPMILNGRIEAPEVFTGGTPCQAFSVAGKRESLSDDRGNLTLVFCEIADAIDEVRRKRNEPESIIIWENVPGVLSTKDNAFGCFLARLTGSDSELQPPGGKWKHAGVVLGPKRAAAWRILDAQYFGVAQRRKRVFVVASARNGFDPAAVLFEFDGVRRDIEPSREAGKEATGNVGKSFTPSSFGNYRPGVGTLRTEGGDIGGGGSENLIVGSNIAGTLDTECGGGKLNRQSAVSNHIIPCFWDGGQLSQTLDAVLHKGQTMPEKNRFPAVLQPVSYDMKQHHNPQPSDTVQLTTKNCSAIRGDTPLVQVHPIALAENTIGRQPHNGGNGDGFTVGGPMYTLNATGVHGVSHTMRVRRLTPVECEKLQGFPPNHTLVPFRGKPAADGPRYKAIGNSWAVPCARWIGQRIDAHLKLRGL